jgi:DNA invertase Pin-like site-specific DNA recombinase
VRDPGDEIRRRVLELKVVNMYLGGVPVKEIVKEVGLSRATVYRILKKYRAL